MWAAELPASETAASLGSMLVAVTGATYTEKAANAPMTLPLTEEQETELQLAEAQRMALLWMRTSAE